MFIEVKAVVQQRWENAEYLWKSVKMMKIIAVKTIVKVQSLNLVSASLW